LTVPKFCSDRILAGFTASDLLQRSRFSPLAQPQLISLERNFQRALARSQFSPSSLHPAKKTDEFPGTKFSKSKRFTHSKRFIQAARGANFIRRKIFLYTNSKQPIRIAANRRTNETGSETPPHLLAQETSKRPPCSGRDEVEQQRKTLQLEVPDETALASGSKLPSSAAPLVSAGRTT
jgi:hypothetical protein